MELTILCIIGATAFLVLDYSFLRSNFKAGKMIIVHTPNYETCRMISRTINPLTEQVFRTEVSDINNCYVSPGCNDIEHLKLPILKDSELDKAYGRDGKKYDFKLGKLFRSWGKTFKGEV